MTASVGVFAPASTAPSGVPTPVGPSQPIFASHIAVPQVPLLPLTVSKNAPVFSYAYCEVTAAWPVCAKIAATSGLAALVPPTTPQPPPSAL